MKYRKEIDGLRAIAVLPVIFFHAGFDVFKGGYIGVDVFFVISGYLITSIIVTSMIKEEFSLIYFYERRVRRILPALFFVMLCCIPFAWYWLGPDHFVDFSQSLTAISLFSSNFLFWSEIGYFAPDSELKPLLHTWSLAVEEQYYLIFPLIILIMWKYGLNWIYSFLVFVAIFSLILAQGGAHHYPSATFFLLPTRAWELAIGALIAFYFLYKKENGCFSQSMKLLKELFGIIGLSMILSSIFYFDQFTPFPSAYALIPTLGTALIIVCSNNETFVGRLLGTKYLVGLGLISYSAYLWHYPLIVFLRHKSLSEPGVELLLAISVLSLVIAYFSWRFIERPFRDKTVFSRKQLFSYAFTGVIFFVAFGVLGHTAKGYPERFGFSQELVSTFSRAIPDEPCFDKDNIHKAERWYCVLGDNEAVPSYVVFGDSHVLSIYDIFNVASKKLDLKGTFIGASGCTPFIGVYALRRDQNRKNCFELNWRVYNYIVENNIKDIFLVARWSYYTDGGYDGKEFSYIGLDESADKRKNYSRDAFMLGFKNTIREYKKINVNVNIISQVPQQLIDPESAYKQAYVYDDKHRDEFLKNVSVTLQQHKNLNNYASSVFESDPFVNVINLDDVLCDNKVCLLGTKYVSYYFDDDHLSLEGAKRILPDIQGLLERTID